MQNSNGFYKKIVYVRVLMVMAYTLKTSIGVFLIEKIQKFIKFFNHYSKLFLL